MVENDWKYDDHLILHCPIILKSSGLSDFMPRIYVTTLVSRNPMIRSLLSISFIADVGFTNLKETVTIGNS